MIRRSFVLGTAAVTLAIGVSACGGGGGNSSPSPTPTPTSTVSPTPTASPTYTAFPLTANTEFRTINAFTSFTGDPATGPIELSTAGTDVTLSAARFRLAALADPTAVSTPVPYVLLEAAEEIRYTKAAQLTTPPATTVREFVFTALGGEADPATTPQATAFDIAELLNNTVKDKVTTDAALALTRVSYAGWYRGDSATGQKRISYGVFGYQTATNDLPITGNATYTTRIAGRAAQATTPNGSVFKLGGTATITVNYATGLVTVAANVTKIDGGTETPFGAFSGTGAIATGLVTFNGSFDAGSPLTGTVVGGFFGSQGEQIGIALAGSGTVGGADTRVVAAIVGKKN